MIDRRPPTRVVLVIAPRWDHCVESLNPFLERSRRRGKKRESYMEH